MERVPDVLGFAVEQATNGYDAVQKARAAPPDLILMDLWMPVLDGIEATKQLKADATTAHIPVLAVSAQTHAPTAEEATRAGAAAFIPKSGDPDVLLGEIRTVMRGFRPVEDGPLTS